jgi:hypothetical protein
MWKVSSKPLKAEQNKKGEGRTNFLSLSRMSVFPCCQTLVLLILGPPDLRVRLLSAASLHSQNLLTHPFTP